MVRASLNIDRTPDVNQSADAGVDPCYCDGLQHTETAPGHDYKDHAMSMLLYPCPCSRVRMRDTTFSSKAYGTYIEHVHSHVYADKPLPMFMSMPAIMSMSMQPGAHA
jgi:hypothetical protein